MRFKLSALVSCLALVACSDSTPPAEFMQRTVNLIYPSGYGTMGYRVSRLVEICTSQNGQATWEKANDNLVLNCDRFDPLSKSKINVRWLLQPAEIKGKDGSAIPIVALIGLHTGGMTASRQELEVIASSIN